MNANVSWIGVVVPQEMESVLVLKIFGTFVRCEVSQQLGLIFLWYW
jgi:hypothetical protein